MSDFSSKGLSIIAYVPLVQGGEFLDNYSDSISSYTHTISTDGGYISAEFTINGNQEFIENWFQYGLGRHIQVFNPQLQIIWEGYVNQVDANMGYATYSRGPMSDLANRVCVWYTPIFYDPDTLEPKNPKETGVPGPTIIVEDTTSQEKYGIWEKVVNIGEAMDFDAETIRNLYIAENKWPIGNPTLNVSGESSGISISIKCRGYIDWINNYVYNYDNGTDECISLFASDKIIDILQADPNDIISSTYDYIDFNGYLVCDNEPEYRMAKTVIEDIINFGDIFDSRWTFGVYANRMVHYSAIPTDVEYVYYRSGKRQQVETVDGGIVEPWDVVPGKYVAVPTFLAGFPINFYTADNFDPRVFFAEEVSFTVPDQVSISGAKVRRLSQLMTKLGLGGA